MRDFLGGKGCLPALIMGRKLPMNSCVLGAKRATSRRTQTHAAPREKMSGRRTMVSTKLKSNPCASIHSWKNVPICAWEDVGSAIPWNPVMPCKRFQAPPKVFARKNTQPTRTQENVSSHEKNDATIFPFPSE